ncbi:hypothetical protein C1646_667188 [Rhizophagus diaphanus]|nr:hypothetical protein C1646_667188 [Rhizophagus diaphanus] [Rhizophagus sp. MUCL 43196]
MKHKICIHVTEFISSILHGVASCYDGEVKVCSEYKLFGRHGKGPVDWIIKIEDTRYVIKRNAHIMRTGFGVGVNGVFSVIISVSSSSSSKSGSDCPNASYRHHFVTMPPFGHSMSGYKRYENYRLHICGLGHVQKAFWQIKWVFDYQIESQELLELLKQWDSFMHYFYATFGDMGDVEDTDDEDESSEDEINTGDSDQMIVELGKQIPKTASDKPPVLPDKEIAPVYQTVTPEISRKKKQKRKARVSDDK